MLNMAMLTVSVVHINWTDVVVCKPMVMLGAAGGATATAILVTQGSNSGLK
jgi:hypothetical protein